MYNLICQEGVWKYDDNKHIFISPIHGELDEKKVYELLNVSAPNTIYNTSDKASVVIRLTDWQDSCLISKFQLFLDYWKPFMRSGIVWLDVTDMELYVDNDYLKMLVEGLYEVCKNSGFTLFLILPIEFCVCKEFYEIMRLNIQRRISLNSVPKFNVDEIFRKEKHLFSAYPNLIYLIHDHDKWDMITHYLIDVLGTFSLNCKELREDKDIQFYYPRIGRYEKGVLDTASRFKGTMPLSCFFRPSFSCIEFYLSLSTGYVSASNIAQGAFNNIFGLMFEEIHKYLKSLAGKCTPFNVCMFREDCTVQYGTMEKCPIVKRKMLTLYSLLKQFGYELQKIEKKT